jgi:hypothetical protein
MVTVYPAIACSKKINKSHKSGSVANASDLSFLSNTYSIKVPLAEEEFLFFILFRIYGCITVSFYPVTNY